jgi:hypothetical protein
MQTLHTLDGAIYLLQILASIFLAILFLQSGLDKVVDRRGNVDWLTGHFAKSVFAGMVPLLLTVLTILEIATGILSAAGALLIVARHDTRAAFFGAVLSAIAILCLFFGQRMAKDYPGAATLVPYFLVAMSAIYLLAQ